MCRFIWTVILVVTLSSAGLAHTGEKHEKLQESPPSAEVTTPEKEMNQGVEHEMMEGASETRPAPQVPLNPARDVVLLVIFTAGGIWLAIRNYQHFSKGAASR